MPYSKSQFARCGVEKNLGFLYNQNMAKRCGFPPVYKIERVEKMSAKRVFFGALQKIMVVCCAIFFGIANAFSANLPSGYTELEYIESTGTQYIDTGIVGKSGVSVEAKFMLATDANGSLFGNRQSDNTRFWPAMWFKNSGSSVWQWNTTVNVDTVTGTVNKNTLYTTYFVSNSSGWTFDVNGERVSSGTQVGSNTNNMWMFGTNDGRTNTLQYPFVGKAYYAKIWQNGTLVRNLIPAKRDSDSVVGMYDTVNNVFYTNKGTGTFTAGPVVGIRIATTAYNTARFSPVQTDLNNAVATIREIVTKTINQTAAIASLQADKQTRPEDACPAGKKCLLVETEENGVVVPHWFPIIENICGVPSGYTCLDYIQSDGNSWIETDYRGTEKTGAYLKYQYHTLSSNLGGRIFGYRISEQNQWVAYIGTYTGTTVNTTTYYIQSGAMSTSPEGMPTLDSNIHEVKINTDGSGKIYFDSRLVGNSLGATAFTASQTLRLFSAYNNSSYSNATARIYEVGIYENGVIKKHFVPAKHGTTVGMYDTVSGNFFTNAGTGTFTAGPEI